MKPSIGRIVHYLPKEVGEDLSAKPWPAIITVVYPDNTVNLTVFGTNDISYAKNATMAVGPREAANGQWWWPERI